MTDATATVHGPELNNGIVSHRYALIMALRDDGFDAYEYHSGGGTFHVAVNLYADKTGATDDVLMIATGDIETACDVALMGWRDGESVQSPGWRQAPTLQAAREAFRLYWDERAHWLSRFEAKRLT